MPQETIKKQLEQLHEALAANPELDDESRELLHRVASDIDQLDPDNVQDLTSGLQEYAVRFDNEHPTLSEILRQIIDTLGRIGV